MATYFHDTGEEFERKHIFTNEVSKPTSITVGLYDDSTDALAESDDVGAITTEPSDGNYTRLTYSFGTTDFTSTQSSGDWQADMADKDFDVTNTTGTVDSYFVVVSFASGSETSANNHLYWTESLDQSYDLSQADLLTFTNGGLSQT